MSTISLREKSLDALFNEFVNTYLMNSSLARELLSSKVDKTNLTANLSMQEFLASSATAELYASTHRLLRTLITDFTAQWEKNKTKDKSVASGKTLEDVCALLRSEWKLPRFYVLKIKTDVTGNRKSIVPLYMYPAKQKSASLPINDSFITQLKNPSSESEIAQSLKHFFKIDIPNLKFINGVGENSLLVFYEHNMVPLVNGKLMSELVREVFTTYEKIQGFLLQEIAKMKKGVDEKNKSSNGEANKAYMNQRVVSELLSLTGDSLPELEKAIKFLFQLAGITQAVVSNKQNTLIAVYSAINPAYNTLKSGKKSPDTLIKEYQIAEKKHQARTLNQQSTKKSGPAHLLRVFTKAPLHPQKKFPDLPFNQYAELLGRLLVKRAMIKS